MKEGYKSTEFWLSAVVSLLGMLATLGILDGDQARTLSDSVQQVVGGLVAIYATVRYIANRSALKVAAIKSDEALRIAGVKA